GLTEEEMEAVLGGGMSTEELNAYLYAYNENLSEELVLANSIWFRQNAIDVNETFLQTNKDYYDAEIYEAPFDNSTVKEINDWVNLNTKEMIPDIIRDIHADMLMILINALAFEAEWAEPYEKYQQKQETFTALNGEKQTVTMMHSSEERYLEDENTTGFVKYYKDGNYAFAALLPDEDMDFADYVNNLDGEKIAALLNSRNDYAVNAAMPKFENEYEISMVNALQTLGIKNAFSGINADFSEIGTTDRGNLYIGNVLHKTYIAVDNFGTKAAAVTEITIECTSAALHTGKIKNITLDRPFVYMIIDTENNLPIFIGTVTDIG
ncbi:MAG: serpin family protein, partial [Clostridia bacterium]|nr:serpin family protein [Clostridia bacterium]